MAAKRSSSKRRQKTREWVKNTAGGVTDLYLGYMAGKDGLEWSELCELKRGHGKDSPLHPSFWKGKKIA